MTSPRLSLAVASLLVAGCATTPEQRMEKDNPIVQTGAEVLRLEAAPVRPEDIGTPDFQALIARMVAAMREAPGVGLAAPQLGVSLQVLVLEDRAELQATLTQEELAERERVPVPLRVFVNPTLTPIGEEKVTFFEGCLSVAGYAALVPRFREVEVSGLDERGQPVTWRVKGWPARILQHEVDHLKGTLYIDRMVSRSFGTLPQVKARFGGKSAAEVRRAFGVD
ncbi:MAG: peptide deformylase [Myxococcota bacterium]